MPEAPLKSHLYTFYVARPVRRRLEDDEQRHDLRAVFDGQDVTGIGCLAIAPSNENIVWVGTGDASSVRVTYPGDGVYKSTDAGKTWQKMGLQDTRQIGRIVIHPTNPDIVYVAAMGRLWSPSQERGVFKTIDGGKTWTKILYVNDKTGAIDLVDQPAPARHALRRDVRRAAPAVEAPRERASAAASTRRPTAGRRGRSWPAACRPTPQGRIGLDIYQKNPNILYAVTENFGEAAADRGRGQTRPGPQDRAAAAQHRRRGLPDRRRREDLAEDERGHRRHELRRPGIPSTRSASTRTTTSGSSSTATRC